MLPESMQKSKTKKEGTATRRNIQKQIVIVQKMHRKVAVVIGSKHEA